MKHTPQTGGGSAVKVQFNLPMISGKSKIAHIFLDLNSGSLVSLGKLCNGGFTIEITQENIDIKKHSSITRETTEQAYW